MVRKLFSFLAIAFFAVAVNFAFPNVVGAEQLFQANTPQQSNQSFKADLYDQNALYIASQDQDYNSTKDSQSSQNSNDNQGASQSYQANNDEASQGYQGNNDQASQSKQSQKQSSSYNQDKQQKS